MARLDGGGRGTTLALVVALAADVGCGARTSLDTRAGGEGGSGGADGPATSSASASGGGDGPTGCPRAEQPARLSLGRDHNLSWLGNVASDGCSFAATWIELRDGRSTIVATTFRVVDGAWQAAPVVDVALAGGSNNSPEIAWDGAAYVVAWADEVLHLQRLDVEGVLLGDVITSFAAPGDVYVRWLHPVEDGSLRVGFTGHGGPGGYDVHVARIGAEGDVLAPPVALTATGDADIAGFLPAPEGGEAFWTSRRDDRIALLRARFEDASGLVEEPVTMITGDNVLVSRHGAALAGSESYVGVLRLSPAEVALARVGAETHVLVEGVGGGDVPVLAATGRGALGVIANRERLNLSTDLALTVVEGGMVVATP